MTLFVEGAPLSLSIVGVVADVGIRKAVGASDRDITRHVVGATLRQASLGAAVGLSAAWLATRYLDGILYQVEPTDPATAIAAIVVLTGAVVLASWIPARRLIRIHPSEVLKSD